MTISATTAALFRLVSMGPITILFDEVDALFNQAGGANEDLRGLLNAGYKPYGVRVPECLRRLRRDPCSRRRPAHHRVAACRPARPGGPNTGRPYPVRCRC